MMAVEHYDLDRRVFDQLHRGIQHIQDWQGAASGIADYVATWGLERFWSMSRSMALLGGAIPAPGQGNNEQRRYFAWGVARLVLAEIVGAELRIRGDMTTQQFQERLGELNFNQQVLMSDLLIAIAETIQFWTMRLKDARDADMDA
ncbi:hypothetical protein [Synechococcus sp. C9]|jgi:hypothetical protein|uniref:hypothetical protein n=1 Tax=Synechococcus sp. C9 TaxID=102119 RepID=UPI001FF202FB|nr:hypothetical protein [Synechococcus sp. C9]